MSIAFLVVLILFVFFVASGMPLVFAMGLSTIPYWIMSGFSLGSAVGTMFNGMDSFVLLAIPLFIFAGNVMNEANITNNIMDFSNLIIGRFRGGLAYVNVLASMFFGGCTGSAISDVAGLGTIEIPMMLKSGYEEDFSAAVTVSSSLQGPLIPPSIPMVIYAAAVGTSTGALLLGGLIPGILLGVSNMVVIYFIAKKRKYPRSAEVYDFKKVIEIITSALPALFTPVILMGGIISGIFTPTEAAAIAVFYAIVIGFIVYKSLSINKIYRICGNVAKKTGAIVILSGSATLFGKVLALERVPQMIVLGIKSITSNPMLILLMLNIILLLWGMVMDTLPALLILAPIFSPLVESLGIDPVHFGVVMVFNLMIGLMTPPYGLCLFTATQICNSSVEEISKAALPFLIINIGVLLLITNVPEIVLFIPRLVGLVD
jgi:tripartite ATP-independent transporter DctM subunit